MIESKISITNKGNEKLVGLESAPSSDRSKYPTVILVHGFGVTKEENGMFGDLARLLADSNYLVYRFDFSGRGESEGNYSETSLTKLKDDLAEILNFVNTQPKVDINRIGILSQSLGTATTIALEPKVKCLVMMGSVAHPKEILAKLFGDGYHPTGISTRIKNDGTTTKVKPQFWSDLNNHNLLESIKKIHSPILFIHGGKDDKVPLSEMDAYFQNANEPKEKIILEGADHGLRPQRAKMHDIVLKWFNKYLMENQ